MRILAPVLLAVVGCGSSDNCKALSGSYKIHFDQKSGDCGDVPDTVTVLPSADASKCKSLSASKSASNACTANIDESCESSGRTVRTTGTVHVSDGNKSAKATVTIAQSDASGPLCTSTYDITYSQLSD